MAAPAFSDAGETIGSEVSQAQRQLDGMGAFWGNDAPGQKFGATYSKYQAELLDRLGIIASQLQGVSDGIDQMASNYHITENANLNKIRALQREMPS